MGVELRVSRLRSQDAFGVELQRVGGVRFRFRCLGPSVVEFRL